MTTASIVWSANRATTISVLAALRKDFIAAETIIIYRNIVVKKLKMESTIPASGQMA